MYLRLKLSDKRMILFLLTHALDLGCWVDTIYVAIPPTVLNYL